MRDRFARNVAGKGVAVKLAQALNQTFNGHRPEEPQHIERVLVLEPSRLSFRISIGKLMQLRYEESAWTCDTNVELATIVCV